MDGVVNLLDVDLFIVILAGGPPLAELMSNTGFEEPLGPPYQHIDDNWSPAAGTGVELPSRVNEAPNEGSWHLKTEILGIDNSFAGVVQLEFDIVVGEEYTFSLFARKSGDLGIQAVFRTTWLDADGNIVGDKFENEIELSALLTEEYSQFTQSDIAPEQAATLRAVFGVGSFGPGNNVGTVFVDDMSVIGPEP